MTEKGESHRTVVEELGVLSRQSGSGPWPEGSELRRRSRTRQRRRLSVAGSAVVVLVIVVGVASVSLGGAPPARRAAGGVSPPKVSGPISINREPGAIELLSRMTSAEPDTGSTAEDEVATAEEAFSIEILKELASASPGADQLVSPFSLAEALAMTELAARGSTAAQIQSALHLAGISESEQADGWAALDEDLVEAAKQDHIALNDANSIWTEDGFPVNSGFLADLKNEFGAGVWQTDFDQDPDAADRAVNHWVSTATDGQIPSLLQPADTPASTAFVILNAVLFEARWADQLTTGSDGTFDSSNGPEPVSFLTNGDPTELMASSGSGIDAVQIPYWNGTKGSAGRYAALFVMPTAGSLAKLVSGLDPRRLEDIVGDLKTQNVSLQIPQCKIGSTLQLEGPLESMGITAAFGPAANFSGFSTVSTQLSEVKQKATLRIDKWGSVASGSTAVVGIASAAESGVLSLTFDHPFLFMIRDTKTGAILFESTVDSPASAG